MDRYEIQLALGTALAVGLLIGLEREQSKQEGSRLAGVRTYPIIGVLGALAAMLGTGLVLGVLAGLIALVAISYAADLRNGRDPGVTTETSVIATYLLGVLASSPGAMQPIGDRMILVAALGVALTFLLTSKSWIHALAAKVARDDLFATLKFLIVAVIVLPLLPRTPIGPFDALTPFQIGLLTVTIAGISFLGFVAIRWLGPGRGVFASAALGGVVSSTAVTLTFARRGRRDPHLAPLAAAAIGVAWSVMVVRIGVLVAIVAPSLLGALALPLAGALCGCAAASALTYRQADGSGEELAAVKNPFELGSAVRFALLFAVVMAATSAGQHALGDRGVLLVSGIGGATDIDAVTLSIARLSLAPASAALAILVAALTHTFAKMLIALGFGGRAVGRRVAMIALAAALGGAAGWLAS